MYYLSGAVKGDLLGVKDTVDNVEEFYSKEFLLNSGMDIVGLTSKLNRNFGDEYFIYERTADGLRVRYTGKDLHAKPVLRSTIAGEKITNLFETFSHSAFISIDMSLMDLSNVINLGYLFSNCSNLESIIFGGVNTSNVKDYSGMFCRCVNLKSVDLSSIDMSGAIYIDSMFYGCSKLKSVDFGTGIKYNVRNASSLFNKCDELERVDLSSFCFNNLVTTESMFWSCLDLKEIKWAKSDWGKLKNCKKMFYNCMSLGAVNLGMFHNVNTTLFTGEMFNMCDKMLLDCRGNSFPMLSDLLREFSSFNGVAIALGKEDSRKLKDISEAETAMENARVDFLFLNGISTNIVKTLKVPKGTSLEAIYIQLKLTEARNGVYILKEI